MKTYYHTPVQVMFHDCYGWNAGIAFEDKVICAHCGDVVSIGELIEDCDDDITCPIYEYKEWASLTDDITGDFTEIPRGLVITKDYVIKEVQ